MIIDNDMKILITGGCGFIGSNIAIFLKNKINKLTVDSLDDLSRNSSKINLIRLKKNKIKYKKINNLSKIKNEAQKKLADALNLIFSLPSGTFATSVLRELLDVQDNNLAKA